jgi:hypothetical protein
MVFVLRLLLAQNLVHLFEGITFDAWLNLLRREQYKIDPVCWPRAAWITALSLVNSATSKAAERRFGAAIEATRVEAPIFILGHYRSGTTHLHELLATDPRFASPTRYQAFNPRTFLLTEPWLAPFVEPFMLPRRVQEDEVAYMVLTQQSPYMDWCFARSRQGYGRYLTFRDVPASEVAEWSSALRYFLKAVTLKTGRPLILKSPPHTARVRLILRVFPTARFIHIRRNPYAVFSSTMGLLRAVRPVFRLQRARANIDTDAVLEIYTEMYNAYFADRALIPPGQLVEISYEDLESDRLGQLEMIYKSLNMGDFEAVRPAMEKYLASIARYKKNKHPELDESTRERIAQAWRRSFDEWGYPC